jgi:hypothetical protein
MVLQAGSVPDLNLIKQVKQVIGGQAGPGLRWIEAGQASMVFAAAERSIAPSFSHPPDPLRKP